MGNLLTLQGVRFNYASGVEALAGVDLSVGTELVGLLGPNGAGKTTLLNVLARRLVPQHGSGRLLGLVLEDPRFRTQWLERVGFLPQEESPPGHLSGREVVRLALALARPEWSSKRRRDAVELSLQQVGLASVAHRRAIGYSGGMRRRLGLARVLASEPTLLLIDEPTSGLDPEERVTFRELLSSLAEVTAVVVSTHIAADVEVSCSRVVVFASGRVHWDGSPTELVHSISNRLRTATLDEQAAGALGERYKVTGRAQHGDRWRLRFLVDDEDDPTGEPDTPTLEEAYVDLIGRTAGAP